MKLLRASCNTRRPTNFFKLSSERLIVMSVRKNVQGFLSSEQGAELAEYAVGVALLVAIGLIVYKVLGNTINDKNSGTASKVDEAAGFNF